RPIDDLPTDSVNVVKAIERRAAECRAADNRQHDRDGDTPSEGPARKFLHFDQMVRVLADDHEVSARQQNGVAAYWITLASPVELRRHWEIKPAGSGGHRLHVARKPSSIRVLQQVEVVALGGFAKLVAYRSRNGIGAILPELVRQALHFGQYVFVQLLREVLCPHPIYDSEKDQHRSCK